MSKAIFVIIFAHQLVIWYLTIFWWKWGNKKFLIDILKKIRIRCINLSIAFGEQ
jgi:hypothetical protein